MAYFFALDSYKKHLLTTSNFICILFTPCTLDPFNNEFSYNEHLDTMSIFLCIKLLVVNGTQNYDIDTLHGAESKMSTLHCDQEWYSERYWQWMNCLPILPPDLVPEAMLQLVSPIPGTCNVNEGPTYNEFGYYEYPPNTSKYFSRKEKLV